MRLDETHAYPLGPALDVLRHPWQLNHGLEALRAMMEKRLGVTVQQRLVVRCIGKRPGTKASQLALMLHVDPGSSRLFLTTSSANRLQAALSVSRGR